MNKNVLDLTPGNLTRLRRALLGWYDRNRRDLPWRRNSHPYHVWVSEIMLQQTRVAAVFDHYARFMQKFPTVHALAAARESSVLAAWSGLGYYHRARRMHQSAKVISHKRGGEFPQTAEEWRELPGIGRYTAAAIASIALGEAVAAVDGNVQRALSRMSGRIAGREAIWQRAETLLDHQQPGNFNQAMMELGAIICTPRNPQCELCPLNAWCESRSGGPAKPQAIRKRQQSYYTLIGNSEKVLLVQRPTDASLMAGMWELPVIPEETRNGNKLVARLRHSITDTDYDVSVFAVAPDRQHTLAANGRWFSRKQWERLPLTGLARKVLRLVAGESSRHPKESNQSQLMEGKSLMATLSAGVRAPSFTLPTVEGKQVSLDTLLQKGPVVLAFFKVSCPVCQYAFPFFERLYRANQNADVTILGISQNNLRDTKEFLREYGVTFSVALDDPKKYEVSNAYGLTNVPTLFYVAPDGGIEVSSVGWSKADSEAINQKIAEHCQQTPAPLWLKGEEIQDFRAG